MSLKIAVDWEWHPTMFGRERPGKKEIGSSCVVGMHGVGGVLSGRARRELYDQLMVEEYRQERELSPR